MTDKADIAVLGLAVMGENLALNFADNGAKVAVWNRNRAVAEKFLGTHGTARFVSPAALPDLVAALERPRRLMLMVKAGAPVDQMIEQVRPLLEPGDILLDGGNSWFADTRRRAADLEAAGIRYVGIGVSGGEEGARYGPSMMPGGPRSAYEELQSLLEAVAAKTKAGPCVTYIGPDGAGHFVKMVHNGIEYGDMQLIAESYDVLHRGLGLTASELADLFARWNQGRLESFLIDLTATIFRVEDPETGQPLVDLVLDRAGQKGTGKWTLQAALDAGVPVPTISAAVDARILSSLKAERVTASRTLAGPEVTRMAGEKQRVIDDMESALLASKVCSYAQGLRLIQVASEVYGWSIDLSEVARIWMGGCIIRAALLERIRTAYRRQPDLPNLLLDPEFGAEIAAAQPAWRRVTAGAQQVGIAIPATTASLAYFDSYRSARLPQNLTQAQRDAFGAHTYERIDSPERGPIHSQWKPTSAPAR
jgi:6-phosphogluconate dehydrogenase